MKLIRYFISTMILSGLIIFSGCTDLNEIVYDEVTEDSFDPTTDDLAALIATGYAPLRYIMGWQGLFDLQEEPADVMITPTRPNGWDDGGTYKRMHWHKWNAQQWQPRNTWITCYNGINKVNLVMKQINEGLVPVDEELKPGFLAELRALRALWYSILCDTHGNVPVITSFSEEIPEQKTRTEVFNFIIDELTDPDVIDNLSEEVSPATYGRMNKWATYTLLARMYLNAEVYTGTAHWQDCIDACQAVIESTQYDLEPNYKSNFVVNNEGSVEIIFAVPYDNIYAKQWNQHMKTLASQSREVFDMEATPWGGSAANPQFIDTYHPEDKRLTDTWLMGQQYTPSGDSVYINKPDKPLKFTKELPSLYSTEEYHGYRNGKYEIEIGCKASMSNDFPYFRYADILLMKAECLMRLGSEDEAADLVTLVRSRNFEDPADAEVTGAELLEDTSFEKGTIDEDGNIDEPGLQTPLQYGRFLDELGWEFACEARRRTDLIRFGKFTKYNWFNHVPQGDHTVLFIIGEQELNTNPNLEQNPGY
ncbi:MAG: RagB/SusD family nutrient uptake outer membrane protein [Bacteroidales bacterium]